MSKKKSLRFWEAAFKRKAVRPEVCLQLWLFVCCCFCVLGCWICAGAALLYVLKFLVSNHMFFFPLPGDSLCQIAFVAQLGSQFYMF